VMVIVCQKKQEISSCFGIQLLLFGFLLKIANLQSSYSHNYGQ